MLTEEEKARIRAEEVFRLEVREGLAAAKPQAPSRQSLWSLVNSAFGLWLLSSVLLTGLTTAYTGYRNQREQQLKKEETENRLNTEINGRMFEALKGLAAYQNAIRDRKLGPPNDVYGTVVSYLDNSYVYDSKSRQDLSIYPEFQKRNFQSLLIELSSLGEAERIRAHQAFDDYMRLKDRASKDDTSKGPDEQMRACLEAVSYSQQVLKGLMKGPWQPAL